ncbi:MAG: NTP transferase domain-containing protein [Halothermotrichaceae bacterium]
MSVDVLILAGAKNKGPLRDFSKTEHEALIEINNTPMVEYVIRAAKKADNINKIAVVGPQQELESTVGKDIDIIIEAEDSMRDNLFKGINVFENKEYLLLMSADIPLITAEVIDDFVVTCLRDKEADIYYPIIPKEKNKAKFPSVKRTYFHLTEGVFTGGNMVLLKPPMLNNTIELVDKAISWRKKPWKLSKLLGMKFIFKFVIGHLSIQEIESTVSEITGYKGHFLVSNHPEIGFDVDKPSDLEMMRDKYIL